MKNALASQLIYVSRATVHVDRTELAQITSISRVNNARKHISGALVFCDGYFLQILEGEPATLEATLDKISIDARHTDVRVLERRHNVPREFADWNMSCLHESSMTQAQITRVGRCLELIEREELVDRLANDAHLLLAELQQSIETASEQLLAA